MDNLTAYERETIINFSDGSKTASIYTYNKSMIRKLNVIMSERDDIKIVRKGDEWVEYEVPKKWIKVNANRILSDEERALRAERMRNIKNSN